MAAAETGIRASNTSVSLGRGLCSPGLQERRREVSYFLSTAGLSPHHQRAPERRNLDTSGRERSRKSTQGLHFSLNHSAESLFVLGQLRSNPGELRRLPTRRLEGRRMNGVFCPELGAMIPTPASLRGQLQQGRHSRFSQRLSRGFIHPGRRRCGTDRGDWSTLG
ncbi:uncharacterized protein LOC118915690 isoform X2 [Manis pentadactyla]|uniref:uncharacterized protein LOC118915690 isoform X2 n=1 Tax=Manis pentadactyla TaxID=143292 RepID=UPI00255C426A|nr:uncharacterized protein LOC118915690 isoform X2 [Manis pentadactyla]